MKNTIIILITIIFATVSLAAQSDLYPTDQNKKKEKKIIRQIPKKQKPIIKKSKTEIKKKKTGKKKIKKK
jgi:hypothetical protein